MKCAYCAHDDTKVVDSRESEDLQVTRRRRECEGCGKRFTTYERVEIDLTIVKKDGTREPFSRDKVLKGVVHACEKRPVAREHIEHLVNEVERQARQLETSEIPSTAVGELVMKELQKLDKVAFVRFASVYREFDDVEEFKKEIARLQKLEAARVPQTIPVVDKTPKA